MKKITLTESDLLKIVKRVLNEQEDKEFDEDQIELLHFIFERELKPPFRKGEMDEYGDYPYYNRDGEKIGYLNFSVSYEYLTLFYDPFGYNIKDKVCQVFEFSYDAWGWGGPIMPHLKSWLEDQLNIELRVIG